MHVGLPEPNGTGSIWMIGKLVTIAGRILCSSVSRAIWTNSTARSNYCRLLQQVHIPGDAMEGTTADQSVWLGEDRSPPAERHFEAAAAGMRR